MKKLIIILFVVFSLPSYGTIYYVSTSGNNGNNGTTESTPWQTLAYAEANATSPGDTIALKRGDTFTITLAARLKITQEGTAENPIVWDGYLWGSGDTATIKGSGFWDGIPLIDIPHSHYLTFERIVFDGESNNGTAIYIGGYWTSASEGATNDIIIQDCRFYNMGQNSGGDSVYGVLVNPSDYDYSNITIRRNYINGVAQCGIGVYCLRSDMGSSKKGVSNVYIGYNEIYDYSLNATGEAIVIQNKVTNCTIEHNTCHYGAGDNAGFGLVIAANEPDGGCYPTGIAVRYNDFRTYNEPACYIQSGGAFDVSLYYNLFYRHTHDASYHNAAVSTSPDLRNFAGSTFYLYNNTIVVNHNSSYCFGNSASDVGLWTVKNNIFYHTGTPATGAFYSYKTIGTHNNNLYYIGGGSNFASVNGTTYNATTISSTFEATCQKTDPALTNTAGFDWTLTGSSPAIDNGADIDLTTDYAGNAVGDSPDIGAYEYDASPPVLVTSITISAEGSATTISVADGTLQLYTNVEPDNATDTTKTWSVINGTGSATIEQTGIITAVSDGTVTARATANDASGVYDDYEITISNQEEAPPTPAPQTYGIVRYNGKIVKYNGKIVKQ